MYHIETLPIHPQPQALETLTSYMTRLAEANAIRNVNGLSRAFKLPSVDHWTDVPPKEFGLLPQAAHCSELRLLETTFYQLGCKFMRKRDSAFTKFLAGAVPSHRRYCPHCLAETGYDRLPWRFIHIQGCIYHRCALVD